MAYTRSTLSGNVGPGAGSSALYTYKTADTKAQVAGANYFNGGADMFNKTDIIVAECSDGLSILSVSANDGTTVTVVAQMTEV
jgi:hypothetical protein